jgi:hypothetical protein
MDKKEFATNFGKHATPQALEKLLAFQESADAAFQEKLMPFAQANGSGSFYALWDDGSKSTSDMPVVAFGDEGGVHVVAENARGLLQLLCFDAEPMIDFDEVTYYKNEDDHEPSDKHDEYVEWLKQELDLAPADPKAVMQAATAKHKAKFDAWFGKYVES